MDSQTFAVAVAGAGVVGLCVLKGPCAPTAGATATDEGKSAQSLELHDDQLAWLTAQCEQYGKGKMKRDKALRCLIDYLRDQPEADVTAIFTKKYCLRCGGGKSKKPISFDLHAAQMQLLDTPVGKVQGIRNASKAARVALDWAMSDGKEKGKDIFGTVRCLNC